MLPTSLRAVLNKLVYREWSIRVVREQRQKRLVLLLLLPFPPIPPQPQHPERVREHRLPAPDHASPACITREASLVAEIT